jgi:hypothetical protein
MDRIERPLPQIGRESGAVALSLDLCQEEKQLMDEEVGESNPRLLIGASCWNAAVTVLAECTTRQDTVWTRCMARAKNCCVACGLVF